MADEPTAPSLLPPDGLAGSRIAISASESADLARLGLSEIHFRLALGEIARSVLVAGGGLAYGGSLDPDGYTAFLNQELHRYSRRDGPLKVYLAWSEHRSLSLTKLKEFKAELGLFGDVVCLSEDGREIDGTADRSDGPSSDLDDHACSKSLTALRQYMAAHTDGRVLIGGKYVGYLGSLPGVLEEALAAIEHRQPMYLAGGFGGMTFHIIKALGIDSGEWFPAISDEAPDHPSTHALDSLAELACSSNYEFDNGLTVAENRKLAATHRPSEIAALVSLGLGRRLLNKRS